MHWNSCIREAAFCGASGVGDPDFQEVSARERVAPFAHSQCFPCAPSRTVNIHVVRTSCVHDHAFGGFVRLCIPVPEHRCVSAFQCLDVGACVSVSSFVRLSVLLCLGVSLSLRVCASMSVFHRVFVSVCIFVVVSLSQKHRNVLTECAPHECVSVACMGTGCGPNLPFVSCFPPV